MEPHQKIDISSALVENEKPKLDEFVDNSRISAVFEADEELIGLYDKINDNKTNMEKQMESSFVEEKLEEKAILSKEPPKNRGSNEESQKDDLATVNKQMNGKKIDEGKSNRGKYFAKRAEKN